MEIAYLALPFAADDVAERRRLAAAGSEAIARGNQVLRHDLPTRFGCLPLLVLEGAWDEARQVALSAHELNFSGWSVFASVILGALAYMQGDTGLAWRMIHERLPDGPRTCLGTALYYLIDLHLVAAALAVDAEDYTVARAWLEAHDRWLAWSGAVLDQADGHLGWAAFFRAAGDSQQAAERATLALTHAADPRQPLALLAAHRLLGELATEAGDFDDAATHLDAALALADACAAPYERALTLLARADVRAATGRRAEARALLDEARAICVPLGAKPALARVDALTARLTATRPTPAAFPAGLSAREVEVLRLVAEGLTDAQVAERLSLSPRTVGRHLTSIYRKIGVASRAAATRFAVEQRLT